MSMVKIFKKIIFIPFLNIFLKILVPIVTETWLGCPRLVIETRLGCPRLVIEIRTGVGVHNLSLKLGQGLVSPITLDPDLVSMTSYGR